MADETNGHTTSEVGSADHRPDERVAEPHVETPASKDAPTTVWTASDARGPLNEARPLAHGPVPEEAPADDAVHSPAADASTASAAEPTAAAPVASPPSPRRSLIPVALGVVVGAVIGAGSAYLAYDLQSGAGAGQDPKLVQLSQRIDALEQRPNPQPAIDALKASVADLGGKVSGSPKGVAPSGVATATTPGVAGTQASAGGDSVALQQRIAALQASLEGLQKQADVAKALDGRVGELQSAVAGLKAQGADVKTLQAGLTGATTAMAGIQKQASDAQAGVEAIQGQQKTFEGRISAPALAVVADSLVQQIDQGQPYAQQVDALAALGADPARIAILRENARKGVPSAKALAGQFAPLAEPILATEHKVGPNASFLDRLKSGMSSMVSIRNVNDTTGSDLGSQVSRIEADLTHNDVAGAYATWSALPPAAKAKSEAWGALSKTAAEAMDAARALQQGAIASLGGRKS